jgi:regulator of RNase E activity RraA
MELKQVIEGFKQLRGGEIVDALDKMGYRGAMDRKIAALDYKRTVCGPALTISTEPCNRFVPPATMMKALAGATGGEILVIGAKGITDLAFWGGLISTSCQRQNIQATVIDGATRDATEISEMAYPLFCTGLTPVPCWGRHDFVSPGATIWCGGVEVRQGDLIFGDRDGVIVIPTAFAEEALGKAQEQAVRDRRVFDALKAGEELMPAWAKRNA